MDVDAAAAQAPLMPPPQAPMSDDANYVDDDDLAAALARTRRMALKKNKPRSMVDMLASRGYLRAEFSKFVGHRDPCGILTP
jgi:hypothetical protein